MLKRILPLLVVTCSAFAGTWDVVTNFNATNNPSASSVFSYGWGATPAAFAAMSVVTQNCMSATPTECLNNGLDFANTSSITWNGTPSTIVTGTPNNFPDFLNMDPQSSGGTIVRFTAPWTDTYSMTGNYKGDDSGQHATAGLVYHNSTQLQSVGVTTFAALSPIAFSSLSLTAGDTIDFIVKSASDCCFLGTGLAANITSLTNGPGGSAPEPGTLLLVPAALLIGIGRLRRA